MRQQAGLKRPFEPTRTVPPLPYARSVLSKAIARRDPDDGRVQTVDESVENKVPKS
jgi:hypothetical protein